MKLYAGSAQFEEGIAGARMMGGGFGGCTINLVETSAARDIAKRFASVCITSGHVYRHALSVFRWATEV